MSVKLWSHWTECGQKGKQMDVRCNYCKVRTMLKNATRCRNHLIQCDDTPKDVKHKYSSLIKSSAKKSSVNISKAIRDVEEESDNETIGYHNYQISDNKLWSHWTECGKKGKELAVSCNYCKVRTIQKNATRCRNHLIQCKNAPKDVKDRYLSLIKSSAKKSSVNISNVVEEEQQSDNGSNIFINDIFDELKEENQRLFNENKVIYNLLDKYRKCLLNLNTICECNQRINNQILIQSLERHYKRCLDQKRNNKTEDKQNLENQETDRNVSQYFDDFEEELDINSNDFFKCKKCDTFFGNNIELKDHNSEHHKVLGQTLGETSSNVQSSVRKSVRNTKTKDNLIGIKRKFNTKYKSNKDIEIPDPEEEPNSLLLLKRNNFDENTQTYVCPNPNCKKSFNRNIYMKNHFRWVHSFEKDFICYHPNCGKGFKSERHLILHSKVHSKVQPNKSLKSKPKDIEIPDPEEEPNSILLLNQNNFDANTQTYVCPYPNCKKSYQSNNHMKHHFRAIHMLEKRFICDVNNCNKRFKTRYELSTHFYVHSEDKPFACPVEGCQYRSKTEKNLAKHSVIHSKDRSFKCDECSKIIKTKGGFAIHKKRHTNELIFKCTFEGCDQSFSTSRQVFKHKMVAHNYEPRKYVCEWPGCEYQSFLFNELKIHRLYHTGERPYQCHWPGCDKKFRRPNERSIHLRRHSKERNFECEWPGCDTKFTSQSIKSIHMKKIHKNEKRFECYWPGCNYRTNGALSLNRHIKTKNHKI